MTKRSKVLQWTSLSLFCMGGFSLHALDPVEDRKQVVEAVQRLVENHEKLGKELRSLQALLGLESGLDTLPLLQPTAGMSERVRIRLEDGIKAYNMGKFEQAKEAFHLAWESNPQSYVTHFNLGMAYHKLGNVPLAKKMLKAAVAYEEDFPGKKQAEEFLNPSIAKEESPVASDAMTAKEEEVNTLLTNLYKEATSYMRSQSMPKPERIAAVVKLLNQMVDAAQGHDRLIQEYFLKVGDAYAVYEMYEKAVAIYRQYERAMHNKVLPDGYHTRLLQLEELEKGQAAELEKYRKQPEDHKIARKLDHDLEEMEIFAAQLDEFVEKTTLEDPDFAKICQRLGEYRWGNRPGRHVLVVDRYQNLLYSSLEGTVALDRYQDVKGHQFLKDITFFADDMHLKDVGYFTVDLSVNQENVPYVVMYTYVPKHESFIIVRMPREDLI